MLFQRLTLFLIAARGISACLQGCDCSKSSYNCYSFHFPDIKENMFAEYPELSQIVLIGSSLTTLPVGLFAGLSQLQELKMPSNAFTSLPANIFAGLTRLSRVTLSYNKLTSLPDGLFRDAVNLHTLNLDNNQLTVFPADLFSYTTSLGFLDASDNLLSELQPGLFSGLKDLRSASFAQNKIPALASGALRDLSNLQFLNMANNQLSSLPVDSFIGTPKLYSLYLYQNHLCSYGTAVTPESILAVVIAEVKHHVDLIILPQASRCPLPSMAAMRTGESENPSVKEESLMSMSTQDVLSATTTSTTALVFQFFLVLFVLAHFAVLLLCYYGVRASRRHKDSEFTV